MKKTRLRLTLDEIVTIISFMKLNPTTEKEIEEMNRISDKLRQMYIQRKRG